MKRRKRNTKLVILILVSGLLICLIYFGLFLSRITGFIIYFPEGVNDSCVTIGEQQLNDYNVSFTQGLVAYYRFNNLSYLGEHDSKICDFSGKGHGGIVYGSGWNNTGGVVDGAFEFNGVDNYIEIADSDDFSPNVTDNQFSVSFWVKFGSTNFVGEGWYDDYKNFLGKSTWGGGYEWEFRQYNASNIEGRNDRISFYTFNVTGGLGSGSYAQDNITPEIWIYFAGTINGSNVTIYKNGVFRDTDPLSNYGIKLQNGESPLRIGTTDFTTFLNGSIDELRIYNRTLNSSEVFEIYNETLQKRLAWLNMNGSGIVANDTNLSLPENSGNTNTGSSSGGGGVAPKTINRSSTKVIKGLNSNISVNSSVNESAEASFPGAEDKSPMQEKAGEKSAFTGAVVDEEETDIKGGGKSILSAFANNLNLRKNWTFAAMTLLFIVCVIGLIVLYLKRSAGNRKGKGI